MNEAVKQASLAQNAAANPAHSTFVSANAGSGKTTILTNRIARLLLAGVEPQSILCLTFTKAAAGEVQERVFKTLGEWVLMDSQKLQENLAKIGESDISQSELVQARQLFAKALETPSGLKVQTIHAFCASLLRRFPLEAGLAQSFREIDEVESQSLGLLALTEIVEDAPDLARDLGRIYALGPGLVKNILGARSGIRPHWDESDFAQYFGLPAPIDEAEFFNRLDAFANLEEQEILLTSLKKAQKFAQIYITAREQGARDFDALRNVLFTQSGTLRKGLDPEGAKFQGARPTQDELVNFIIDQSENVLNHRYLTALVQFHQFAGKLLSAYGEIKARRLLVDYDDLIERADALLNRDDAINWVMFRLDSQLSHILVDEAQDTNDAQWSIIDTIAKAANEDPTRHRTIFVVGDEKQSIFSFQGADPQVFEEKRREYRESLALRGAHLVEEELLVSFRSSPLILDFVDEVFRSEFGAGLGAHIEHQARADDLPGKIEVLPYQFLADQKSEMYWPEIGVEVKRSDEIELAEIIAKKIAEEIYSGTLIPATDPSGAPILRAVRPGDYLILLRKRKSFFYAVQKALQNHGIPIAGVDRLTLGDELAVKDVMALLRVLQAPYDDLSLGCVLRSPLAGVSESALYQLASKRPQGQTLLEALRAAPQWAAEFLEMFEALLSAVDYLRPHDLVIKILQDYRGAAKLRARLGVVVDDVLEAFLEQLLNYENREAPSLVGFIAWFDQQETTIKRALDEEGGAVRTMTVHGAKGLEAPIVVYPYVSQDRMQSESLYEIEGVTLIKSRKIPPGEALQTRLDEKISHVEEEEHRLAYVALTRARSRLILCGAGKAKTGTSDAFPQGNIYPQYLAAIQNIAGEKEEIKGGGAIIRRNFEEKTGEAARWQSDEDDRLELAPLITKTEAEARALTKILPDYSTTSHGRGKDYGTLFHAMMDALIEIPKPEWDQFAHTHWADVPGFSEAYEEARAVFAALPLLLENPSLRELDFLNEISGQKIRGRMDHVVMGETLWVFDYKTNLDIAQNWDDLAKNYQMQLAVYHHVLCQIEPKRMVRAGIIWSANAEILEAKPEELEAAFTEFCAYLQKT